MAKTKILIIDDQPAVRGLVALALDDRAFDLSMAEDGEAGIAKALNDRPDLILLDLQMPRKNGVQTYTQLRSDGRTKSIPVIMMTAYNEKPGYLKDSLFAMGLKEYIQKPFKPDHLKERVLQLLRQCGPSSEPVPAAAPLIERGRVRIDGDTRQTWFKEKPVKLSPILFNLLFELAKSKDAICKEDLLKRVRFASDNPKTVRTSIDRLRKRFPTADVIVWTGSGYQLNG